MGHISMAKSDGNNITLLHCNFFHGFYPNKLLWALLGYLVHA